MSEITPDAARQAADLFASNNPSKFADAAARPIRAGEPIPVEEYGGTRRFWRVPLYPIGGEQPVAWIDVELHGVWPKVVRYGPLLHSSKSVINMTLDDIGQDVRGLLGDDVTIVGKPELVFLQAPSKVAWKLSLRRPGGDDREVLVTPGTIVKPVNPTSGAE